MAASAIELAIAIMTRRENRRGREISSDFTEAASSRSRDELAALLTLAFATGDDSMQACSSVIRFYANIRALPIGIQSRRTRRTQALTATQGLE
jgi:hypothetical protein